MKLFTPVPLVAVIGGAAAALTLGVAYSGHSGPGVAQASTHGAASAVPASTPATAAPAAAPAASPAELSQSSGQWTYRCLYAQAPATGPALCTIEQHLIVQNPQKKAVQVGDVLFSRSRTAGGSLSATYQLTLQTPLMVSLVRPPTIAIDDGAPVALTWQVCTANGCIARMAPLPDAVLSSARHGKTGHIQIGTVQGGAVTINFELAGLDTAVTTLDSWAHRQSPS
ncbi:putative invasion associated locus B (IalB) protein [Gluconacetobacter diazotrophicus PA1 5]|uniref:Invasion protein n=2 Tax=Gluconacetobacter diazotrophicus TaxID=33996 RepID=A0A7W4I3J3_GLUDI|nr:invasion associated locus B family protein [Gluconacetobacter diazotrophicus]ACI50113.1 putative invasion associated locus B (IalB) protein [Gluconacetobacter diazotrophicus PA1 5]MBB2154967.1 invasion protein [Gluconacetobacter diazotrophicus]TWB08128.1 invasion protein IalB [Gluconacetobacter diazotrophicus]CAP56041.1 putative invasion associated locus B (IalB) protein [Gluconacetobacter diazotrophicus PA1 5]